MKDVSDEVFVFIFEHRPETENFKESLSCLLLFAFTTNNVCQNLRIRGSPQFPSLRICFLRKCFSCRHAS